MKRVIGLMCWLLASGCSAATDETDVKDLQTQLMAEIELDTRKTAG